MKKVIVAVVLGVSLDAQTVLHVGAGQSFPDIGAALVAAMPGDRVLVHAGSYPVFTLTKGVTLRAEPLGAQVMVPYTNPPVPIVVALPAGQTACVQGLTLGLGLDVARPAGAVTAGVLSLEGMSMLGGVRSTDANLSMTGCTVRGAWMFPPGSALASHGVQLVGASTLSATQTYIEGGYGSAWYTTTAYGILADQQSHVHLSGCHVVGGGVGSYHQLYSVHPAVLLSGAARGWFVDSALEAVFFGGSVVGIDNQSTLPAVVERCVTTSSGGISPSTLGVVQSGLVLGLWTNTPLVRGGAFQLNFASRPGFPVIAHGSLQLNSPGVVGVTVQREWGFLTNSVLLSFMVADALGHASTSITIPNLPGLQDLPVWFCGWSEVNLPVQLSPVLGGLIR